MDRFLALVLLLVAFLAFVGSTLGDGEEVHRVCPVTLEEGETLHVKVNDLGRNCLDPTGLDAQILHYAVSFEDHKDFFNKYCEHRARIQGCLANAVRTSHSCQNGTRHQSFVVFIDMLDNILNAGCVQEGEVLANIMTLFKHNASITHDFNAYSNCLLTFTERTQLSFKQDISDLSRLYLLYRDMVQVKECINFIKDGNELMKNGIVSFLSEISEKSKCFHPQDDSVMFCKDLDPKQDGSPKVCPLKYVEGQTKPLNRLITDRLKFCSLLTDENERPGIDDIESLDQFRVYFKNQCEKKQTFGSCLNDVLSLGEACLNERKYLIFKTFVQFLKHAVLHLCIEDGRHLAEVMFKVTNDVGNTSDASALKECLSEVDFLREAYVTNLSSVKTFELYRKLKDFKVCLLNKLRDDDVASASADQMLIGVIHGLKCINPEETLFVICE